jgi:hypothetical protein
MKCSTTAAMVAIAVLAVGGGMSGCSAMPGMSDDTHCWVSAPNNVFTLEVDGSDGSRASKACSDLVTAMATFSPSTPGWKNSGSEPDGKGSAVACKLVQPDAKLTVWDSSGNPAIEENGCSYLLGMGWEDPSN